MRLARTPIRMYHQKAWTIDKMNPDHDLVFCLTGKAVYQLGDEEVHISPGMAMLIPAYTRFRGRHGGGDEVYTGVAQHFSLDLFGRGDLISQMQLDPCVPLQDWDTLGPLVRHYREYNHGTATTLLAHHQFMVLLLSFLEQALTGWHTGRSSDRSEDQLSLQIMLVASRLSADPLGQGAMDEALASVPYNEDYFRRAFRDRIGVTPKKYREAKRMEFAVHRLGVGLSVKEVAAELGYADPYFFSRLFKQYMGASPSRYRWKDTGAADDEAEDMRLAPPA